MENFDKQKNNFIEHQQTNDNSNNEEPNEEVYEKILVLLCSICYAQYYTENDIKNHFIQDHGYKKREDFKRNREDNVKNVEIVNNNDQNKNDNKEDVKDNEDDDDIKLKSLLPAINFPQLKQILTKSFNYKCTLKGCNFKFENKEKLDYHINCHSSTAVAGNLNCIRDFKCNNCDINITNWRNFTQHIWKSHQIDIDMLRCPICVNYKSLTALKIWHHIKKTHKIFKKKLSKTTKSIEQHEQQEQEQESNEKTKDDDVVTKTRWYTQKTCEICDRKFANSKTLSKHIKAVHNKIKPFICNVCGRKSARKSTLIIHMRQHTQEKPLSCKSCSFRASDPSVLKKHENRHKNILQYKCKLCQYKSIQSSSLKMHIKSFHPDEYKKLCCDQCNYVSISVKYLEAHKKDHNKGLITNDDEDTLDCTINKKLIKSLHGDNNQKLNKPITNVEISSDCFLPLESTDSIVHDPSLDTGGVTIPAHSEDTQFPN